MLGSTTYICTFPSHLLEPSPSALYCPCKAPVEIEIMLHIWHIGIIWQNQILLGYKTTQAVFPKDCDPEMCVTVSLQDGRGTSTAHFSAWKTGIMEILDAYF